MVQGSAFFNRFSDDIDAADPQTPPWVMTLCTTATAYYPTAKIHLFISDTIIHDLLPYTPLPCLLLNVPFSSDLTYSMGASIRTMVLYQAWRQQSFGKLFEHNALTSVADLLIQCVRSGARVSTELFSASSSINQSILSFTNTEVIYITRPREMG